MAIIVLEDGFVLLLCVVTSRECGCFIWLFLIASRHTVYFDDCGQVNIFLLQLHVSKDQSNYYN